MQTLVRFFHADGEGLLMEDLKSGDYKVFSPLINAADEMNKHGLICLPSSFPSGPGRGAASEQMLILWADRTVFPGENLPAGG